MTLADTKTYDTLPKLLVHNARTYPNEIAFREKDFGIWNEFTWTDYLDRTRALTLGLKARGIGQDDVIALIGDNRPEWVIGEVTAHALRGKSIGIYRDVLDHEVAYLVNYTKARAVIAEDEEQVDKFLNLGDEVPSVDVIVYADPRGMRKYDDPRLISLEDLLAEGRAIHQRDPDAFTRLVEATRADDICILCTTSGTTSNPKLAMLTHKAMIDHVVAYLSAEPKDHTDEYVSVLPLPWIMEQVYVVGKSLVCRMKINFPEEAETQMADVREIGPTFILLAPRLWESIAADVRARMMDSSVWKQKIYEYGMKQGLQALEAGTKSAVAEALLMRQLRDRLGFSRLRNAATGGAALGPDTFKFFQAMGVPLRQLYGQTELLGAYTIHTADDVDFDTVGVPFPGVKIKIENPDAEGLGEIRTWHPNMMSGYFQNEEASRETFTPDGWMMTGDAGYFDDKGHLVVIDRIKDLAETARKVKFSPQYIENKLKFSPYVAEAVILGSGRDYLAAMICIRYSIVAKWAEKNRISFTTYTDLSARQETYDLLLKEVQEVNRHLPPLQHIKKFLLLYKELDADDGELTRTRKVRRGVIADKYGGIIEAIYGDADTIPVDTTIAFQDGTSQRIKTTLKVVTLENPQENIGALPAQAAE